MKYQYQVLHEEETYRGFFKVMRYQVAYEQFAGGMGQPVWRECLYANRFVVAALPYDPVRQELVFVEQFRIGAMVGNANPWHWEIVAGFMDKEGETPEESIQRELAEEIGTRAHKLQHVAQYFGSPGGGAGQTHLFFAEVDASATADITGVKSEGEDIRVHRLSYAQAAEWMRAGKLNNANTLLALHAFFLQQANRGKK